MVEYTKGGLRLAFLGFMEKEMNKAELMQRAQDLGIDVDGRWNVETLQAEIAKAEEARASSGDGSSDAVVAGSNLGLGEAKTESETTVILTADYWSEEDKRVKAGKKISLPVSKARALILVGKASQPLPGDE